VRVAQSGDGLKRLPTRRGEFVLEHYDLWKHRDQVAPVAQLLRPGTEIALLGSCFADQAGRYLGRRGYRPWSHPAGELYNPQAIRLELEHVLAGAPWLEDMVLAVPGGYTHRFRKRCSASAESELRRLDEEMTAATREALERAEVILVIVGTTTELWRDAASGVATNQIPHPTVFHERAWNLDLGDLDDVADELAAIHALIRTHTSAQPVYTVCPIPLHATWSAAPIVTANGRTKGILRAAVERLPEDAVYLDLWDWVQAQTGRWSPMKADGRHFDEVGIDRAMLFAERRLGADPPPLSVGHRLRSTRIDAGERLRSGAVGRWIRSRRRRPAARALH
jgi:hypothetical protein